MNKVVPTSVYCDGGIVGRNPSKIGGTWCYYWVDEHERTIAHHSGWVNPKITGTGEVSNNFSELYAAYKAIQDLPEGWSGTVITDSQITLWRLERVHSFNGISKELEDEIRRLRKKLNYTVKLVAGHPTVRELMQGYRDHNGRPVSKWNKRCDEECARLALHLLKQHISEKRERSNHEPNTITRNLRRLR